MNNMNNAINTAAPLSKTTAANGANNNSSDEDAFGPVMRQQSDLQSRASSRVTASDQKNQQKSAYNNADDSTAPVDANADDNRLEQDTQRVSDTVQPSDHPETEADKQQVSVTDSEKHTDEVADESDELLSTATLTDNPASAVPTKQGKLLPEGGNNLPLTDKSDSLADSESADLLIANNEKVAVTDLGNTGDRYQSGRLHTRSDNLLSAHVMSASRSQELTRDNAVASTEIAGDSIRSSGEPLTGLIGDSLLVQATDKEPLNVSLATVNSVTSTSAAVSGSEVSMLSGMDKLSGSKQFATPATNATAQFQIDAPVNSPDWGNQIGDRLRWMSKAEISMAELKLNPAELGSIEVKIFTEDQQTRISFITSNATTKEMLESTLPRLREMLLGSGLQLEQSDISHRDDSSAGKDQRTAGNTSAFDDTEAPSAQITGRPRIDRGQIDHYV